MVLVRRLPRRLSSTLALALVCLGLLGSAAAGAQTSTLTAPANGATVYSNGVQFSWTTVTGALAYYLYVGTTVGANDVVNTGETLATSITIAPMPLGTLYARMYTKTASGWTHTDSTFTVVAPPQATLTAPANGASVYSNAVALSWAPVSGALAYYVYVGTTVGAKDVVDSGETSATSLSIPSPPLATLYVRLYTKSPAGWTHSDSTFTVVAPPQATLTAPANGASVYSNGVVLSWAAVSGALDYYVYVGTTVGAKDVVDSGEITATSLAISSPPLATLYVRLYTKSAAGWKYSDSSFTVVAPPQATLASPANGASVYSNAVALSWAPVSGALAYYVYLGTSVGAKDIVNSGEMTATALSVPSPPLGTLYVRLNTKSAAGWTHSDSTFTVVAPPRATLTAPANGATITGNSVTFSWTPAAGAIVYYLYVGTTVGAKDIVNSGETTATSLSVGSLPVGTLYARIYTESAAGWFYSDSTFTVQAGGIPALTPHRVALTLSQTQQFSAPISGGGTVNWTVDGVAGGNGTVGTIDSTGLYVPPAAAGVHTVTATNAADSSKSDSATVAVTDLSGVVTYRNDAARTGQNLQEYALTPATVSGGKFGKRWTCALDGDSYAQPLYVANLAIGGGTHNVLIVATQHDSVYAFDADDPGCKTYWQVSFLGTGVTSSPIGFAGCGDILTEFGITGTPVIDPASGTVYLVAKTLEGSTYFQRLHALDLATGHEKSGSPVVIQGSVPKNGGGSVNFSAQWHNQRPGLALTAGGVIISWASHCDNGSYHGWLMRYDAASLAQTAVFNVTPNGVAGGIWMSGAAPAIDSSGSLFFSTGNGTFDDTSNIVPPLAPGNDFGESFLKLDSSALTVQDFYTPSQWSVWSGGDLDIASAGITILPDGIGPSAHPNVLFGADKQGHLWLIDRNQMSRFSSTADNVVQYLTLPNLSNCGPYLCVMGSAGYWNGTVYISNNYGPLMALPLTNGLMPANAQKVAVPASQTADTYHYPGPTPMISGSPSGNTIVWALDNNANGTDNGSTAKGPAVLRAYLATNLATRLYSSSGSSADTGGTAVKFTVPVVANGHVYVAGGSQLTVYGLAP